MYATSEREPTPAASARTDAADVARPQPPGVFAAGSSREDIIAAYPELGGVGASAAGEHAGRSGRQSHCNLLELARAAVPPSHVHPDDLASASISELVDHLVQHHHRQSRNEIGRLHLLIDAVADGHDSAPARALRKVFLHFEEVMETHLALEEERLFPLCIQLDDAARGRVPWSNPEVTTLIRYTGHGHGECESLLRRAEQLAVACRGKDSHPDLAAIVVGLHALGADLAIHAAEESDLLIPAAVFAEETALARHRRSRHAP